MAGPYCKSNFKESQAANNRRVQQSFLKVGHMKIKQVTVEHGVKIGTGGRQDNSMSRKCRDSSTKENITKLEEKEKNVYYGRNKGHHCCKNQGHMYDSIAKTRVHSDLDSVHPKSL